MQVEGAFLETASAKNVYLIRKAVQNQRISHPDNNDLQGNLPLVQNHCSKVLSLSERKKIIPAKEQIKTRYIVHTLSNHKILATARDEHLFCAFIQVNWAVTKLCVDMNYYSYDA